MIPIRITSLGNTETCDGQDNDCDATTFDLVDGDLDGFFCDLDCDDDNSDVFPGAEEIAVDGIDNDCDGIIDNTSGHDCEIRTDYDERVCVGNFKVDNLQDFDEYGASDFGRYNGNKYKNLKINTDLASSILDIESPCKIQFKKNVTLTGDFVSIDARKGIINNNGFNIVAQDACVLSERGSAGMGAPFPCYS